jgi:hypothetical protein
VLGAQAEAETVDVGHRGIPVSAGDAAPKRRIGSGTAQLT